MYAYVYTHILSYVQHDYIIVGKIQTINKSTYTSVHTYKYILIMYFKYILIMSICYCPHLPTQDVSTMKTGILPAGSQLYSPYLQRCLAHNRLPILICQIKREKGKTVTKSNTCIHHIVHFYIYVICEILTSSEILNVYAIHMLFTLEEGEEKQTHK